MTIINQLIIRRHDGYAHIIGRRGCQWSVWSVNSLRPGPNRRHFADDIFKCIFENENEWISPRISLKFVPKVRINNITALFQIMAWRRLGDKTLSGPMIVSLLTHICVTRPQWVNGTLLSLRDLCSDSLNEYQFTTAKTSLCNIWMLGTNHPYDFRVVGMWNRLLLCVVNATICVRCKTSRNQWQSYVIDNYI